MYKQRTKQIGTLVKHACLFHHLVEVIVKHTHDLYRKK